MAIIISFSKVFVEYKLLGVDPADTETPQSLKVKG